MRNYNHGFLPASITPFYYRALRRHLNPEVLLRPTTPTLYYVLWLLPS
jgi:hypothetical protein